jgi:hypothetical protein
VKEEECETIYTAKALDNMMQDSFKYGYSSNDAESYYEYDEEIRESDRDVLLKIMFITLHISHIVHLYPS